MNTEAITGRSIFGMHKGTQDIHLRLRLTACDKKRKKETSPLMSATSITKQSAWICFTACVVVTSDTMSSTPEFQRDSVSDGWITGIRIDNTHGVLKVCRLVPTAKSSNYKIVIKEHMINCLKQCVVNQEMLSNTPTTGTVVVQCMGVEGVKIMNEMIPEVGLDSVPDSVNRQINVN